MAQGVGLISPWAPSAVQAERRWRDVSDVYLPIDQPRSLLRMLEQGPESQSASEICSGGVSAVMGSSDSWPYFPPAMAFLASVESRIALDGKRSNN